MYIGNKDIGLNLVRDINMSGGTYQSYTDRYNKNAQDNRVMKVADEHLTRIIEANQKNKRIHDIIESIQKNQYEIITFDHNKSMLMLGCAGSGKTMILMHKIRYMKYNHKTLSMDDVVVISPTDILGRESRQLSRLLQIERARQYTTLEFYDVVLHDYFIKNRIGIEEFHVIEDAALLASFYDQT
jgi:hypothetical protein